MLSFLKEFFEFLSERKKLAFSNNNSVSIIWSSYCFKPGISRAPFIYTIF